MTNLNYGQNVVYFLNDLAASEVSDITSGEFESYGEDGQGRDASCSIDITLLAADAVSMIAALQEQVQKLDAIKLKLSRQLNVALQNLNADIELLCIVGSYGDTQSDEDILECLEHYNERGSCMQEIIGPAYKWEPKP